MRSPPEAPARWLSQAAMLANRVRKNYRRLKRWAERQGTNVFRLYDRDIPEVRAVVDFYAGHLVVGEYVRQQSEPRWLPAMAEACAEALGVPAELVHLRQRRTGGRGERYTRLDRTERRLEVAEGGLRFLVNLDDYQDTGLFADHRLTRAWVRDRSAGLDVLNLFAYTGSFSVYAAAGGARSTTSVDLSPTYLSWARDHLALNGLDGPQHDLVAADVLQFLEQAKRAGHRWDLVILDPPSFSTSHKMRGDFDVLRDQRRLVRAALEVLQPTGEMVFSTNHQRFVPDLQGLAPHLEDWTERTVPADYRNRQVHRAFWLGHQPARAKELPGHKLR